MRGPSKKETTKLMSTLTSSPTHPPATPLSHTLPHPLPHSSAVALVHHYCIHGVSAYERMHVACDERFQPDLS